MAKALSKKQKAKNVDALTIEQMRELIKDITINCIHEGREMMNSSEILDTICDTLRAYKCDDPMDNDYIEMKV